VKRCSLSLKVCKVIVLYMAVACTLYKYMSFGVWEKIALLVAAPETSTDLMQQRELPRLLQKS